MHHLAAVILADLMLSLILIFQKDVSGCAIECMPVSVQLHCWTKCSLHLFLDGQVWTQCSTHAQPELSPTIDTLSSFCQSTSQSFWKYSALKWMWWRCLTQVLGEYNKSIICFENTLKIQPDFEAAAKRKHAVLCHSKLEGALEAQHRWRGSAATKYYEHNNHMHFILSLQLQCQFSLVVDWTPNTLDSHSQLSVLQLW